MEVSASKFLENFEPVPKKEHELYPGEDADHEADTARWQREKKIEGLIRLAFKKLGIEIAEENFAVAYEDSTREASVKVDCGAGLPVKTLAGLYRSGLSDDYSIGGLSPITVTIKFIVAKELDNSL